MIIVNNSFQPSIVRVSFIIQITFVNLNNGFSDKNNSKRAGIVVCSKNIFKKYKFSKALV